MQMNVDTKSGLFAKLFLIDRMDIAPRRAEKELSQAMPYETHVFASGAHMASITRNGDVISIQVDKRW